MIYFVHISQAQIFFLARSCRKRKFREIYAFKSKFMCVASGWVSWGRNFRYMCFFDGKGDTENKKINGFMSFATQRKLMEL